MKDLSEFKPWTIDISQGASSAVLDHARLFNPIIAEAAEKRAIERGKQEKRRPTILRLDIEQAIILEQERVINAQAARIRDLVSKNVLLEKKLEAAGLQKKGIGK